MWLGSLAAQMTIGWMLKRELQYGDLWGVNFEQHDLYEDNTSMQCIRSMSSSRESTIIEKLPLDFLHQYLALWTDLFPVRTNMELTNLLTIYRAYKQPRYHVLIICLRSGVPFLQIGSHSSTSEKHMLSPYCPATNAWPCAWTFSYSGWVVGGQGGR